MNACRVDEEKYWMEPKETILFIESDSSNYFFQPKKINPFSKISTL